MSFWSRFATWVSDPEHWTGSAGIPSRLLEHLGLSAFSILVAAAVTMPLAIWLGHRGRGAAVATAVVNVGRAIPSFAIVALAFPITLRLGLGFGFWPTFLALVALAAPLLFTNTLTAVLGVDASITEAAQGVGYTERGVVWRVELPLSVPLILVAFRVATVQVIATATLGALVGWGGLGRFIIDGFAFGVTRPEQNGDVLVVVGAVLVAALAVITELGFSATERWLVPGGLRHERARALSQPA